MWVYVLSLAVVFLDQLTKIIALRFLASGQSIPVIANFFHLSLVKNTGIAFGLFRDGAQGVLLSVSLVLILSLFLMLRDPRALGAQAVAVSFILGGAVGNLIDRVRFGFVVDFFDFRVWPVFNVADSFITVGVSLFLILSFRKN